jgi:hypothetical protein
MKTYFLDTRTLASAYPLVLPLDKALTKVPRHEHRYLMEIGRFRTRRELRRAVKRLQASA